MESLEWTSEMVIGNEKVDRQHHHLVDLVNEFLDAIRTGRSREDLEKVFNELAFYTQTHFNDEEELFKETAYPHTDEHIQEHKDLIAQVVKLKEEYISGKKFISLSVFQFLRKWLRDHILETDKKLAEYI